MSERSANPGRKSIYDLSMRYVVEGDIPAFCDWPDIKLEGDGELLSTEFASKKLSADLLVRLSPQRLLHVEYIRTPEPDMFVRMLNYRGRIMREHKDVALTQVALVLGEGRVQYRDDPEVGFSLGLREVNLPQVDGRELLSRPSLAVLAELAHGDEASRARSAKEALRLIRTLPTDRQQGQYQALINLAAISLDPSTIDSIRKEIGTSIEEVVAFYDQTEIGQELRKQGVEQGREQGLTGSLTVLLQDRFDADPRIPRIASGLAHLFDPATAIHAAQAQSLDELAQLTDRPT